MLIFQRDRNGFRGRGDGPFRGSRSDYPSPSQYRGNQSRGREAGAPYRDAHYEGSRDAFHGLPERGQRFDRHQGGHPHREDESRSHEVGMPYRGTQPHGHQDGVPSTDDHYQGSHDAFHAFSGRGQQHNRHGCDHPRGIARGRTRGRGGGRGRGGVHGSDLHRSGRFPIETAQAVGANSLAWPATAATATTQHGVTAPAALAASSNNMTTVKVASTSAVARGPSTDTMRTSLPPDTLASAGIAAAAATRRDVVESSVAMPSGAVPRVTSVAEPGTNIASNTGTNSVAEPATGDMASSSEQNRRARRAQRAALIFQEQCQQQQAEDAVRQQRARDGSAVSTSTSDQSKTLVLASSAMTNLVVSVEAQSSFGTVCTGGTNNGGKTTKVVNSIHAGPTQNAASTPPVHATANSIPGTTFINKISSSNPRSTSNPPAEKQRTPSSTTNDQNIDPNDASSSTPIGGPARAITMASAKVSSGLLGSDADDGNDSDDDADFIMTRTAGKRRVNVSAADMLANEILDDVNEDLIAVTEVDEVSDPIKRLHRGYMNEAVAMVCIFFLAHSFFYLAAVFSAAHTSCFLATLAFFRSMLQYLCHL